MFDNVHVNLSETATTFCFNPPQTTFHWPVGESKSAGDPQCACCT